MFCEAQWLSWLSAELVIFGPGFESRSLQVSLFLLYTSHGACKKHYTSHGASKNLYTSLGVSKKSVIEFTFNCLLVYGATQEV